MSNDTPTTMRDALRALTYSEARLLVVDDDPAIVMYLQGLLERAGYSRVVSTIDPREALVLLEAVKPDIIILDLQMPFQDGFAVMAQLQPFIPAAEYLPILVLTGNDSPEAKRRALFGGAKDFLSKPFDPLELLLRLHNLLGARFLNIRLRDQNHALGVQVSERAQQLLAAQDDTIERLAQVLEFHDDALGHHTKRVGDLSADIATMLGMQPPQIDLLCRAATLHDVGKVGIPDTILLKPDRLTPDEFEVIKMHTSIGSRILSGSRSEYLRMAEQIALAHHERWDGMGYPMGLMAEDIPLPARIVAVADFYDAVTHERPYRPPWPKEKAVEVIRESSGTHFDPHVVQAFLQLQTIAAYNAPEFPTAAASD